MWATSPGDTRKLIGTAAAPQPLAGEVRGHRLLGGVHVEGDALAKPYAQPGERVGEPAHARVPLRVGPAPFLVHEGGIVGETFDRTSEQRRDVHRIYLYNPCLMAGNSAEAIRYRAISEEPPTMGSARASR